MALNYTDEPIIGGDINAWGIPELIQNRLALPINTIRFYDDAGTLKAYTGKCGLIDSSKYGVCHNTAIYTVSLASITNGNWFKVEVERNGTSFDMTASDTNTGIDTDPGIFPGSFLSSYDHEKGGFYFSASKRCIALGWVNSSGTLEGIVQIGNGYQYAGYSITDDALDQYYRWQNNLDDTFDSNYIGRLYLLEEGDRPSTYILNGGSAVTWTDVDFSAYVPKGVKALLLYYRIQYIGDGALDNVYAQFRQNGSSITNLIRTRETGIGITNLIAGVTVRVESQIHILCDSDGIIEYLVSDAAASLFLTLRGYYMEDNVG